MNNKLTLDGKDNYGKPRQDFADKLAAVDDEGYLRLAELCIWLSAYADNNLRSDYHWQADACYAEAARRGEPGLYEQAFQKASAT